MLKTEDIIENLPSTFCVDLIYIQIKNFYRF